jgi:hypothetical protein
MQFRATLRGAVPLAVMMLLLLVVAVLAMVLNVHGCQTDLDCATTLEPGCHSLPQRPHHHMPTQLLSPSCTPPAA